MIKYIFTGKAMWLFGRKKNTKKAAATKQAARKRKQAQPAVTTHRSWSIGRKPAKQQPKPQSKAAQKPAKGRRPDSPGAEEGRLFTTHRWSPEILLKSFEYESCSWCRRFYTRPTQCPYDRYKLEKCEQYDRIEAGARRALMNTPIWQVVIKEAMSKKLGHASITKCHYCGAINPDPTVTRNWKCYNCDSKL